MDCPRTSAQLVIGFQPYLIHRRLLSLFQHFAASGPVASLLCEIDLRGTDVVASSIVMIMQTCPSLTVLDVGECKKLDISVLTRLLKKASTIQSLVVKHLEYMEVCGGGKDELWIGYRQQHAYDVDGGSYSHETIDRAYSRQRKETGGYTTRDEIDDDDIPSVGRAVQPYVRQIESIVNQAQGDTSLFTMAVNVCQENYCVRFAGWVPQDGQQLAIMMNKHNSIVYVISCIGKKICHTWSMYACHSVGSQYLYCFDYNCTACVCVECDGGISIQGNAPTIG